MSRKRSRKKSPAPAPSAPSAPPAPPRPSAPAASPENNLADYLSGLVAEHGAAPAAPAPAYTRKESDSLKSFYNAYGEFYDRLPADLNILVDALAERSGLSRLLTEYPTEPSALASAASALQAVARDVLDFPLNVADPDPTQLDRFCCAHLIDPDLRRFFSTGRLREDLPPEQAQAYETARQSVRIPREPLLYYCLGAFWGQWLVNHRQCVWALYPPLKPLQSFADLVTILHTVAMHPFSQVTRHMADPHRDRLALKCQVSIANSPYVPPYPLLASPADADHAARQMLPPAALWALDAMQRQDMPAAFKHYAAALAEHPTHAHLLALAIPSAFATRQWDSARAWLERLLQIFPNHPTFAHNLAAILAQEPETLPQAEAMLRALLESNPQYDRARLTLATCLNKLGRRPESRQEAQSLIDQKSPLARQAGQIIEELDRLQPRP